MVEWTQVCGQWKEDLLLDVLKEGEGLEPR